MLRRRTALLAAGVLGACVLGDTARAQGTARSQDIDTSIRAAGMGGAGAAVWWGEPGVWGNPAQLGEVRGIRWQQGWTRLVPSLAPDVKFKSQRLLLGGGGLGFSLMGDPLDGLGHTRLDYGASQGTDPFGNPTAPFNGYEQIEAWGAGLSVLSAFDAASGLVGRPHDLERNGELSVGVQHKHTRVVLGPEPFASAEADGVDWGAIGRISPLQWFAADAPMDVDVAAGYAVLNANDARFVIFDEPTPPSRIRREGMSVHAAIPAPWTRRPGAGPAAVFLALPQLVAGGIAVDRERISAGGEGPSYDVDRFGIELTVLGILDGRIGHVTDRLGGIDGDTYGFGVSLPIGSWGAVRYDHASVPESFGLPRLHRNGWSAWVDPAAIWQDVRGSR